MSHAIRIRLFAAARELAGADTIVVQPPSPPQRPELSDGGWSAEEWMTAIGDQHPQLKDLLPMCRLAVDRRYVDGGHRIGAGREIALIPPVSGG